MAVTLTSSIPHTKFKFNSANQVQVQFRKPQDFRRAVPFPLFFKFAKPPRAAQTPATNLPPLVVVGSANVDTYVEIDRLPEEGETIAARCGEITAGGKGANQAACGSTLSYSTYFVGRVGDDAHGRLITEGLRKRGVHLDHVKSASVPTGQAVVMLLPSGQNSIIILGGANTMGWPQKLSNEDLEIIRNAGMVLLQREIPDSINIQVAEAAKGASVPVILDAGGMDTAVPPELLSAINILSPNETELARMTGTRTESFEQISMAAMQCHRMGVKQVLVKLGARGCALFVEGETPVRQPIMPPRRVVDTTGAGDTFTASFAVALLEGKEKEECLRFASAAASLCVQAKGAIASMPERSQVLELLRSV